MILALDVLRVVVTVEAFVTAAAAMRLAQLRYSQGAGWPYVGASVGTSLLAFVGLLAVRERIHHPPGWPLPVVGFAVTLALWSLIGVLRGERQRVGGSSW